ncbi:glycosylphosphatidylinositol anchor biosynthesis [Apophysomyces ossiformis]|uniref:Mannosyltransferase n=1 Tax=Apophysomyces ossiformis TaxID=679940 RepID=A0A8H7EPM8_9FUNG|nr:glycosylphosphatidylinositol anchor biosynthesis [Apophysomyces ossiformis]
MAVYLSLWHQRGVVDVMLWLRNQPSNISVGVLMPCHSTPWQSVVHRPDMTMWFLTCEPPLEGQADYVDEADEFYLDPLSSLNRMARWPSHFIMFDHLLSNGTVADALQKKGFQECRRFFNSHFHDDTRRRGDVVVLCRE